MIVVAAAAIAAVLAAGSNAGVMDRCNLTKQSLDPYKSLCVYFTGVPTKRAGEYQMALHYVNTGAAPIRGQINAYVQSNIDLDTVASHAPSKISSPVRYAATSKKFSPLARIIGIPGGLKPHQELVLKLTYTGLTRPSPNTVGGVSFNIQFWMGALVPKNYPKSGYSSLYLPLNS